MTAPEACYWCGAVPPCPRWQHVDPECTCDYCRPAPDPFEVLAGITLEDLDPHPLDCDCDACARDGYQHFLIEYFREHGADG